VSNTISIQQARLPQDLETVRDLFIAYADSLGIDLGFQGFEAELATLPGKYQAPAGRIMIAWIGGLAVGCVALRALNATTCEMKRLYVRPEARGEQLGRQLAERICREAREAGYSRICLDTLPSMASAQSLYGTLGFLPIEPYVFNPITGTKFLALDL
jgi:GNAT superfamily N-acetyltransferase